MVSIIILCISLLLPSILAISLSEKIDRAEENDDSMTAWEVLRRFVVVFGVFYSILCLLSGNKIGNCNGLYLKFKNVLLCIFLSNTIWSVEYTIKCNTHKDDKNCSLSMKKGGILYMSLIILNLMSSLFVFQKIQDTYFDKACTKVAPVETTVAPVETTVAPVETTVAPVQTMIAPGNNPNP